MTRPFRFGVQISKAASRTDWIAQAQAAESLGYAVCVMPDHITSQLAPFPAMTAVADATSSIRIGTFVLDNDFRHPLLTAQEAATVQVMSEGRLELGMGAGWLDRDYRRLGIDFDPPATRVARLREAVTIVAHYFRGEAFSFEGSHYRVEDVEPVPLGAAGRPRLVIGGGGKRMLEFAAREADVVAVFLTATREGGSFEISEMDGGAFDRKIGWVRAAASDRDAMPELNVLVQHVEVTESRDDVAAGRARELGVDTETLLESPLELIGTVDEIVDDLRARRDRYGVSYVTVFAPYMHSFAPIVEELAGT